MRCRKDCGQGLLNNWLAKLRQKILGHAQQARALLAGQSLPVCKQLAGLFVKGYYECQVAGHDKKAGKLK